MKLLFDQNLSPKLIDRLADVFPGSAHVDRLGLGSQPDQAVWDYAKMHDLLLVSKDSDFHERSLLHGYPPKVVWIRRGNCSTQAIELLVRNRRAEIAQLADNPNLAFVILL